MPTIIGVVMLWTSRKHLWKRNAISLRCLCLCVGKVASLGVCWGGVFPLISRRPWHPSASRRRCAVRWSIATATPTSGKKGGTPAWRYGDASESILDRRRDVWRLRLHLQVDMYRDSKNPSASLSRTFRQRQNIVCLESTLKFSFPFRFTYKKLTGTIFAHTQKYFFLPKWSVGLLSTVDKSEASKALHLMSHFFPHL